MWAGVLVVTRLLLLWHSANRATRALGRCLIGDCLPFPLAGRPFHRFQVWRTQRHKRVIAKSNWTFRFCSVANALALPQRRGCNSTRGRSFLRPSIFWVRKPHTNSPAHMINSASEGNKNFHAGFKRARLWQPKRLARRPRLARRRSPL